MAASGTEKKIQPTSNLVRIGTKKVTSPVYLYIVAD